MSEVDVRSQRTEFGGRRSEVGGSVGGQRSGQCGAACHTDCFSFFFLGGFASLF